METIKNNYESVLSFLEGLDDATIINMHNIYCMNASLKDGTIYINDEEFFETFFTVALDAVRSVCYGEYNYTDNYVVFNGYGNLDSSDRFDEWIDKGKITNDILENEGSYSNFIELE